MPTTYFILSFSLHTEQEADSKRYDELVQTVNQIERLNPEIYNVEFGAELDQGVLNNVAANATDYCQKQGYLFFKK